MTQDMKQLPPSDDLPTVVFDLDGTLAETGLDLVETLNRVLAEIEVPPISFMQARTMIGHGARALISLGLESRHIVADDALMDQLFQRFMMIYEDQLCVKTHLYPDVLTALQSLERHGYRMAVCTNKIEKHSITLLEKLQIAHYFKAICGRDTFPYFKPDPRHLVDTIKQAGGNPRKAIMVGDSITDLETARNAGLPSIGVSFGYTVTPMSALGPDRLVDHYRDLMTAIQSL
jgi:phosphoglycolate phosphatase